MTTAREHTVAQAVADALNAAPGGAAAAFGAAFTAVRRHLVRFDTVELATLRVAVVPMAKPSSAAARTLWNERVLVGVAVQKKLDQGDDQTQLDALALLAEKIEDYLKDDDRGPMAGGSLIDVERSPTADPDALAEREYRAIIRLTYFLDVDTD